MPLTDILARLGSPDAVSGVTQYGKWGRSATMVAHYIGTGLIAFRFDSHARKWLTFETATPLVSVVELYRGDQTGLANLIACFRGFAFRNLMKFYNRPILADPSMIDLLAERIADHSYESDKFDDDGMQMGVQLVAMAKDSKTSERLKKIADHAGTNGARKDATKYLRKIAAQDAARQRDAVKAVQ
jgi:hypothetical protein